jgi:carboxypeptidase C (cathepsin A)
MIGRATPWLRMMAVLASVPLLSIPALGQGSRPAQPPGVQTGPVASGPSVEEVPEAAVVSRHSMAVGARKIDYQAAAGFLPIRDESGKLQAKVFYVAYSKEDPDEANRPLTFAFNGGPGAASLWLHLGAMGPKRIALGDDGKALPNEVRLVDNEYTWLDFTDLVFVDPIEAGYSRAEPGVDAKQFLGVEGDIRSMGEFIRLYVSRSGRWLSPKLLAGESYGTTRAAGLANYLQRHLGMDLSGLILLSSALSFQTFTFDRGNDLPYMLYLPTYTAVAWYHQRLSPELQKDLRKTLEEAEQWAVNEYGPALAKGDDLPEADRKKVVAALGRFTGLPEEYIFRSDLRVPSREFAKELLRNQGKVLGILDGRVTGLPLRPVASSVEYDPSLFLIEGPFAAAMQDYLRRELNFKTDQAYEFLSAKAGQSWNWGSAVGGYVNVTDDLQAAMTMNSKLRVFAGIGDFDLTCGYYAQEYAFNHLGLAPSLRKGIRLSRYPSGHQIYNHSPSLKQLSTDAAEFMKDCTAGPFRTRSEAASRPAGT